MYTAKDFNYLNKRFAETIIYGINIYFLIIYSIILCST